jgi:hypothetical protein
MIIADELLARVYGGAFDVAKGDGCTAAADGWWRAACDNHDVKYMRGGSAADRQNADRELRADMISHDAPPIIAWFYQMGVRIGGAPQLPTPWRWGFGQDLK